MAGMGRLYSKLDNVCDDVRYLLDCNSQNITNWKEISKDADRWFKDIAKLKKEQKNMKSTIKLLSFDVLMLSIIGLTYHTVNDKEINKMKAKIDSLEAKIMALEVDAGMSDEGSN